MLYQVNTFVFIGQFDKFESIQPYSLNIDPICFDGWFLSDLNACVMNIKLHNLLTTTRHIANGQNDRWSWDAQHGRGAGRVLSFDHPYAKARRFGGIMDKDDINGRAANFYPCVFHHRFFTVDFGSTSTDTNTHTAWRRGSRRRQLRKKQLMTPSRSLRFKTANADWRRRIII